MRAYGDLGGDSGIAGYEPGPDYIRIEFTNGTVYLYTDASTGAEHVAEMKRLAAVGRGLNTYLNRWVRGRFARRER